MNELVLRTVSDLSETGQGANTLPAIGGPTDAQKAAIILSVLEPDVAVKMLQGFDEETISRFARAVMGLDPVPPNVMDAVVFEFLSLLESETGVRGGIEQARKMLEGVLDERELNRIISRLENPETGMVWERMNDLGPEEIATFLQLEHPQTIALILSRLKTERAAAVLERMDRETAQSVILRLADVPNLDSDLMDVIERAISVHFLAGIHDRSSLVKPAEMMGNLMNNISSAVRDQFLEHLQGANADFAADVIKEMFTFADIAERVAPNDVAKIVKDVEEEKLIQGLRYARDKENPSYDFIMSNLSKRLSERLTEEVDALDRVKERDGEAAQMEMVAVVQRKAKSGEITLIEVDPDD